MADLQTNQPSLEYAQSEADRIQNEIDYCVQQRNVLFKKAEDSKVVGAKQLYLSDVCFFLVKAVNTFSLFDGFVFYAR